MTLGVHTSIAGGLFRSIDRARELGCGAMQIFGRNPRSWIYSPLPEAEAASFRSRRKDAGMGPVLVHTNYLINLCSPDEAIYRKSIDIFCKELGIAEAIGADYLVTHLGSPKDMGAAFAVRRVSEALGETARKGLGRASRVLIENTSGAGSGFGSSFADIGAIMDNAGKDGLSVGLCFDTCHAFAAGYSFLDEGEAASVLSTIGRQVGLDRLMALHINDSKGALGSHLDRHEHIGKGRIGLPGFRSLLTLPEVRALPMILETPKQSDGDDLRNLKAVADILKGL